jgi:hypothetical protein
MVRADSREHAIHGRPGTDSAGSAVAPKRGALGQQGERMRMILMSAVLSLYAATALAADTSCKETATSKKLAGAALTSFMTKCQKDAQSTCDKAAQDKKLYGAAKTSFTTKCVKDATGA